MLVLHCIEIKTFTSFCEHKGLYTVISNKKLKILAIFFYITRIPPSSGKIFVSIFYGFSDAAR